MFYRLRAWAINFVNNLNPFRQWRLERQKDREMILEVAREIGDALRAQANVSIESLRVMNRFLQNFETNAEPESRTVRDEDEVANAMARFQINPEEISENDDPFRQIY